jgi:hypothetical protein
LSNLLSLTTVLAAAGMASAFLATHGDLGAPCEATAADAKLPAGSEHTGLAGRYELTIVSQGPQLAGRRIVGALWLWRSSATDSSRQTGKHVAPGDTVRHPYFGATNLNLWDLTATALQDEAAIRGRIDPVYPQVLLRVRGWPSGVYTTWKELTLWIESIGNRRDGTLGLDGAGFALDAVRLRPDGFDGRWGPAGIVSSDTGYFCATRVERSQ